MPVLDTHHAMPHGCAIGDMARALGTGGAIRRFVLGLALLVVMLLPSRCHAEEPLFLDGDPRYPLIYAIDYMRHYLDLDSCVLISGDANAFEISARYIDPKFPEIDHTYRFRKNEDSDGELEVWGCYDKDWAAFPNPQDEEAIEWELDEKGRVGFRLPDIFMFKVAYQHLFGVPYEDDMDDEALRRSVIILPRGEERPRGHKYLWDDENYPQIYMHDSSAWYIDESSVFAESETPPRYILGIHILQTPNLHFNDILPTAIFTARFLYDDEAKEMSVWKSNEWRPIKRAGSTVEMGWWALGAGAAAFRLAYGRDFYE